MLLLNEDNLDKEISGSKPVLVDFFAPWCGPCRAFLPILERLSQKYRVAKADVQEYPALATKFGIGSIPTIIIFKEGKAVQTFVGLQNEQVIANAMEQWSK